MDRPSVITVEIAEGFILSVMFPRETFFLARAYLSVRPSVFHRWVFFFICDRISDEIGVTDDYYTNGRVPSVWLSVIISPTEFIPFTDGIIPSVKLFNGVVIVERLGRRINPSIICSKTPGLYHLLLKQVSLVVCRCYS